MNGTKDWWTSQGVWANATQILTGIAVSMGIMTGEVGATIVATLPGLIVSAIMIALGAWGLWGRVVATKKIA